MPDHTQLIVRLRRTSVRVDGGALLREAADALEAERDRLAAAVAEVMPILNMDGERHPKLEAALKAARGERP